MLVIIFDQTDTVEFAKCLLITFAVEMRFCRIPWKNFYTKNEDVSSNAQQKYTTVCNKRFE